MMKNKVTYSESTRKMLDKYTPKGFVTKHHLAQELVKLSKVNRELSKSNDISTKIINTLKERINIQEQRIKLLKSRII